MAELYTAGKLAEKLGVSQGKVKKIIEAENIEPDEVKRNCKYYSEATAQKVKALLEKS
jgi:ribosomal protein L30E